MRIKTEKYENIYEVLGHKHTLNQPPLFLHFTVQEDPFRILNVVCGNTFDKVVFNNTYVDNDLKSVFFSKKFAGYGYDKSYSAQLDKGRIISFEDTNGAFYDSKLMSDKCPFMSLDEIIQHQSGYILYVEEMLRYEQVRGDGRLRYERELRNIELYTKMDVTTVRDDINYRDLFI